jgi:proteasome lid subunit RPN8/RPN11
MLEIDQALLTEIQRYGELAYPEEGAGMLLGRVEGGRKKVISLLPLTNAREQGARHNRYLLTPQDYLLAEQEAARQGLDILGVFHSHPDHPNCPSAFDLEWAMPWLSYLITSVQKGRSLESRSWRLDDDRSQFIEEEIVLVPTKLEPVHKSNFA